jgi:riboflavin synthase
VFTGVVEEIGLVRSAEPGELRVEATEILADLSLGQSVAVDGVDLTVSDLDASSFAANVMRETYRRSALGALAPGRRVNLERSLLPTTRLSGHIVRGVVEGTACVRSVVRDGDALIFRFSAAADLLHHMVVKGPVAVDGASFTIIDRDDHTFAISVVAYSQTHTTITERAVGDAVNIETDILARYVDSAVARIVPR